MVMIIVYLCLFGFVSGHMGVSSPGSRERPKVGDAYRYPNAGHCHGIGPGTPTETYASGDTVKIQLSSGAAHNGGHCALFLARPKADNEQKWYKQMDNIDCTLNGGFDWKIEPSLVPSECNEGCTLIWVWTPFSSGACEIYMNCFDIKITGAVGPADPSAITINKNPPCQRVNEKKQTLTYGQFCETNCAQGTLPPSSAPAPTTSSTTSSPTPKPAPTAAPKNQRCGLTWTEANNNCRATCTVENEATKCFGGTKCYADMTKLCETEVDTDDDNIITTKCSAAGVWGGNPTINRWCADNCPAVCPPSHCECKEKDPQYVRKDTPLYVPSCQEHTTAANETIADIALQYDLAAYVAYNGQQTPDEARLAAANDEAAKELLSFNQGCQAVTVMTIADPLPEGITVFITGDCQLTDKCPQRTGKAANQYSTTISCFITLAIFFYHQF